MFAKHIIRWRKNNNLDHLYPWRNSKDPYKILVSEILLKKTTRSQVAKEWKAFVKTFPNFSSLSIANLNHLKKIIRPLGIESVRSRQLKALAGKIIQNHRGRVPNSKTDLLNLPGVGPYTTNAVLCFAYKKDVSMVDTNILRVLQRVFSIKSQNNRPRQDKKIWEFAEALPPKGGGKDFNYGILDFAAEVCTPKNPKCRTCLMKKMCCFYMKVNRK